MSPDVSHASANGRSRRVQFLALLGSVLILTACSTRVKNPYDSPRRAKEGYSRTTHRVRFEVSCSGCLISWRAGWDQETVVASEQRGLWSRSVFVHTDLGESVATLSASPGQSGRLVSWVRIRVDGKIAAQETNDEQTAVRGQRSRKTLSVETLIPPPEG